MPNAKQWSATCEPTKPPTPVINTRRVVRESFFFNEIVGSCEMTGFLPTCRKRHYRKDAAGCQFSMHSPTIHFETKASGHRIKIVADLLELNGWRGYFLGANTPVSHSRAASLSEALTKTFDGKHPCSLCKAIQKGRADEKKQEQQQVKPGSKLDLGLVWQPATFDFDVKREQIPSPDFSALSMREQPPKPRPRTSHDSLV